MRNLTKSSVFGWTGAVCLLIAPVTSFAKDDSAKQGTEAKQDATMNEAHEATKTGRADKASNEKAMSKETKKELKELQGQAGQTGTGGSGPAMKPYNAKDINSQIQRFNQQTVAVAGELKDRLSGRVFVIESGGIFNDEITVVVPKGAKGLDPASLQDDADVVVTGKVQRAQVVEVHRDADWWDLDPEIEAELTGERTYLIADSISRQRN